MDVFDAAALERDLAKLKLKRPITAYWRFFVNDMSMPGAEIRAIHSERLQSDDIVYVADEVGEVIDMCARLNQYLRMIHSLSGNTS